MNLLSIQGHLARNFHLNGEQQAVFHSVLHSLFDHQYVLINSTDKIDLIYDYNSDLKSHLTKKLCEIKNKSYSVEIERKFYHAVGSKNSLESFFIRLYQVAQRKDSYEAYIAEFDKIAKANPDNPVIMHILGCFNHIDLHDFKNMYANGLNRQKLVINRHKTYAHLINYLDKFIHN